MVTDSDFDVFVGAQLMTPQMASIPDPPPSSINRPKEATDIIIPVVLAMLEHNKLAGAATWFKVTLIKPPFPGLCTTSPLMVPRCHGFLQPRWRPLSHTSKDTQTSSRCLNSSVKFLAFRGDAGGGNLERGGVGHTLRCISLEAAARFAARSSSSG